MHVAIDQSAYCWAAGSSFANNPTSLGLKDNFCRSAETSPSNFLAIPWAKITLQVAGTGEEAIFVYILKGVSAKISEKFVCGTVQSSMTTVAMLQQGSDMCEIKFSFRCLSSAYRNFVFFFLEGKWRGKIFSQGVNNKWSSPLQSWIHQSNWKHLTLTFV